jgi:hypothetical protein
MSPGTRDPAARLPSAVRALRWILFALLVASAALTLVALPELQDAAASGRWPGAVRWIPPAFLALFVVVFGVYRFALVRAGRYPAGKALVRLGLLLLVGGVIAGIALERARPELRASVDLGRALRSSDPDVRAMAAELARHRPAEDALPLAPRLADLVEDASPEVRREAHASLVALAGSDVGGEGAGSAERWRRWAGGRSPR